jgi:hypothetical protein
MLYLGIDQHAILSSYTDSLWKVTIESISF